MPIRILQFFPHQLAARNGGPYTYLHHLKTGMKENDEVKIFFLSDLVSLESGEQGTESGEHRSSLPALRSLKNMIPKKWIYNRRITNYLKYAKKDIPKSILSLDLNQFNILHFHEAIDLWRYADILKKYEGKILFTSHSPTPYHLEMLEEVFGLSQSDISPSVYRKLEEIDTKAFSIAQQYVFPCREALVAYYEDWPQFSQLIIAKPLHYVLTGIPPAASNEDVKTIRARWKIPENAFVISYTGRHSTVKGFDLLVKTADRLLHHRNDIYFLVAGTKKEQENFEHPRWIETGWTNDPYSLIHAANLHVIPNRKTYFDLNTLEAMSLGKPVIITDTGGNAFFKKIGADGLMFTRMVTVDDLVSRINNCYNRRNELPILGDANKKTYEQYFTVETFCKNYIELYKRIES